MWTHPWRGIVRSPTSGGVAPARWPPWAMAKPSAWGRRPWTNCVTTWTTTATEKSTRTIAAYAASQGPANLQQLRRNSRSAVLVPPANVLGCVIAHVDGLIGVPGRSVQSLGEVGNVSPMKWARRSRLVATAVSSSAPAAAPVNVSGGSGRHGAIAPVREPAWRTARRRSRRGVAIVALGRANAPAMTSVSGAPGGTGVAVAARGSAVRGRQPTGAATSVPRRAATAAVSGGAAPSNLGLSANGRMVPTGNAVAQASGISVSPPPANGPPIVRLARAAAARNTCLRNMS